MSDVGRHIPRTSMCKCNNQQAVLRVDNQTIQTRQADVGIANIIAQVGHQLRAGGLRVCMRASRPALTTAGATLLPLPRIAPTPASRPRAWRVPPLPLAPPPLPLAPPPLPLAPPPLPLAPPPLPLAPPLLPLAPPMALRSLPADGRCPLWLGFRRLVDELRSMDEPHAADGGVRHLRVEVQVDGVSDPAHWLCHQQLRPRLYFSDQHKSLRVAGVGEADRICGESAVDEEVWRRAASVLGGACGRMRFYGGGRFDAEAAGGAEWAELSGALFVLPLWELQACDDGKCFLACHLRWGGAAPAWGEATESARHAASQLAARAEPLAAPLQAFPTLVAQEGAMSPEEYEKAVQRILAAIEAGDVSKVVLAQRMRLRLAQKVDPMHLLLTLLEADAAAIAQDEQASGELMEGEVAVHSASPPPPRGGRRAAPPPPLRARHAYLFLLQPHDELSFMGCTPEKLFKLHGDELSTEAIAGTRRRGATAAADAELAHELLRSDKDLREVHAVRDFLVDALGSQCRAVAHEPPFVLQLRHVQHICVPFTAQLAAPHSADPTGAAARSALALLHPTPAVCGTPPAVARATIRQLEPFDRGYYAGPLGYIASDGCEFCVAIRSALLAADTALVYAGGGIVRGSAVADEWEEVHNKMKNFISLFPAAHHALPSPSAYHLAPNANALHASLLVEELVRCGVGHVVLSPGSRCAPLTVAVARSQCAHSLCTDERGAAFIALGLARASGRCAAVVVSSGTAAANLLPAVVEASLDHVPLLLLTADRPPELRDTSANQTITQTQLFGGYARWFKDMPPPAADAPLEPLLSDAGYAVRRATCAPAGPVHLNLMYREPLAPREEAWGRAPLESRRMRAWLSSRQPFTAYLQPYALAPSLPDAQLLPLLELLRAAARGIVVVGCLTSEAQRLAAAALAAALRWPMATEVCSGLRQPHLAPPCDPPLHAPLLDLILADAAVAEAAAPDVVLQVGGRLVSKRVGALLRRGATHVLLEAHADRVDPEHTVTHRLQGDVASMLAALHRGLRDAAGGGSALLPLAAASAAVEAALHRQMAAAGAAAPTEPWVAHHICAALTSHRPDPPTLPTPPVPPASPAPGTSRPSSAAPPTSGHKHVLFVSNSMPVRDLTTFCASTPLVLCNRGASGIDGVMHSAIGAALACPPGGSVTLLIGDLATLHDLNAITTLSNLRPKLIVVVLNNAGGGIFRFLPIAQHADVYSPYFDTPHRHQFEGVCRGCGLPYVLTATCGEFEHEYASALLRPGPSFIEVQTDKEENFECHRMLAARAAEALHGVAAAIRDDSAAKETA
ncbi:hypothetical protein AB1Y20_021152 [Prymnesium parvum]|uniref:isochorismate synthase n=1 Tax=Prymnesium parvum TaxID=97485 RepID=A0AB34JHI5_PRYPA